jgi:hypothetical protein
LLLSKTVLADNDPGLRLYYLPGRRRVDLGGQADPLQPLALQDGRYLRLSMALYLENVPEGERLKVSTASFQYQADADPGTYAWIFRYEYLRDPGAGYTYPQSHLHINGELSVPGVLADDRPLPRIHFPTRRIPLEAVIRLLVEQFQVRAATPFEFWRPLVARPKTRSLPSLTRPSSDQRNECRLHLLPGVLREVSCLET